MRQNYRNFREFRTPFFPRYIGKIRACIAGDGAICSKNRQIFPYHSESPDIARSGTCLHLRSPFLIMAPDLKSNFVIILDYLHRALNNPSLMEMAQIQVDNLWGVEGSVNQSTSSYLGLDQGIPILFLRLDRHPLKFRSEKGIGRQFSCHFILNLYHQSFLLKSDLKIRNLSYIALALLLGVGANRNEMSQIKKLVVSLIDLFNISAFYFSY